MTPLFLSSPSSNPSQARSTRVPFGSCSGPGRRQSRYPEGITGLVQLVDHDPAADRVFEGQGGRRAGR